MASSSKQTAVDNEAVQVGFVEKASPICPLTFEDSVQRRVVKRTIRRVDLWILPVLGALYSVCVIDRTNLGFARVAGMDYDLELSVGARYSIVSCLYFIPYILLQLPSNIMLRKVGVTDWLTFCVIAWGAVQLAMGFVKAWGTLALCRTLLGTLEAGFFPGLVFIITTWYTRHEVQQRLASFYISSVILGGFSAVLTYAFTLLGGKHGIAAWRWIFIVEGVITLCFGAIGWFFIPDFPDQNKFLTGEQTKIVLSRVEKDRGDSIPDEFTVEKVYGHLMDWKIWAFAMMNFCCTVPGYAISYFLTNILVGMGWSLEAALLLNAPPYIVAAASTMVFAFLSDRHQQRALTIAVQATATIVGLLLVGFAPRPAWKYIGIFLAKAGSGGCVPGILAYSSNNVVSHTKRGVTTAVVVSFSGLGGIVATTIFRQEDAPGYMPGIYTALGCQVLLLVLLGVTTVHFKERNIQVQQCPRAVPIEGKVGFEYTL